MPALFNGDVFDIKIIVRRFKAARDDERLFKDRRGFVKMIQYESLNRPVIPRICNVAQTLFGKIILLTQTVNSGEYHRLRLRNAANDDLKCLTAFRVVDILEMINIGICQERSPENLSFATAAQNVLNDYAATAAVFCHDNSCLVTNRQ